MTKRKSYINWNYIEPLYRIGSLSNYKIAEQYCEVHKDSKKWKQSITESVIRHQAKTQGWEKNLADHVQSRIQENLILRGNDGQPQPTDYDLIQNAADVGTNVILRHRTEIATLMEHENRLLDELSNEPKKAQMSSYQGQVTITELELTVKEKAETLRALALVRAQRIALERQAHNLNGSSGIDETNCLKIEFVRGAEVEQ